MNIVLGDSDVPKAATEPPKLDKIFELAKVSIIYYLHDIQLPYNYNEYLLSVVMGE